VIDRCNLTILDERGQEGLAEFLAAHWVEIVASMPCYLADNVDRQRRKGTLDASTAPPLTCGRPLPLPFRGCALRNHRTRCPRARLRDDHLPASLETKTRNWRSREITLLQWHIIRNRASRTRGENDGSKSVQKVRRRRFFSGFPDPSSRGVSDDGQSRAVREVVRGADLPWPLVKVLSSAVG